MKKEIQLIPCESTVKIQAYALSIKVNPSFPSITPLKRLFKSQGTFINLY